MNTEERTAFLCSIGMSEGELTDEALFFLASRRDPDVGFRLTDDERELFRRSEVEFGEEARNVSPHVLEVIWGGARFAKMVHGALTDEDLNKSGLALDSKGLRSVEASTGRVYPRFQFDMREGGIAVKSVMEAVEEMGVLVAYDVVCKQ